jgi:hypothetical protein
MDIIDAHDRYIARQQERRERRVNKCLDRLREVIKESGVEGVEANFSKIDEQGNYLFRVSPNHERYSGDTLMVTVTPNGVLSDWRVECFAKEKWIPSQAFAVSKSLKDSAVIKVWSLPHVDDAPLVRCEDWEWIAGATILVSVCLIFIAFCIFAPMGSVRYLLLLLLADALIIGVVMLRVDVEEKNTVPYKDKVVGLYEKRHDILAYGEDHLLR